MTTARRRPRRKQGPARPPGQAAENVIHEAVPLPQWHWRTFPVFFAFALGSFIGLYAGVIAQGVDNGPLRVTIFVTFAILLGVGFSRLTTRWMISKRWVKQRPRKR